MICSHSKAYQRMKLWCRNKVSRHYLEFIRQKLKSYDSYAPGSTVTYVMPAFSGFIVMTWQYMYCRRFSEIGSLSCPIPWIGVSRQITRRKSGGGEEKGGNKRLRGVRRNQVWVEEDGEEYSEMELKGGWKIEREKQRQMTDSSRLRNQTIEKEEREDMQSY